MKAVWGSKSNLPTLPSIQGWLFWLQTPPTQSKICKVSVGTTYSVLNLSQSRKSLAATKPLLSDRISCEEEGRRWQACFESKVRQERGGRQKPHEHRTTCGQENQCQLIPADFFHLSIHGPNVDPTRKVVISSKMRCCSSIFMYGSICTCHDHPSFSSSLSLLKSNWFHWKSP